MSLHTLTPDLQYYVSAVVVTWCLGSSNIATHIYSRWFTNRIANPLVIQSWIKAMIVLLGSFLIPIQSLFFATKSMQMMSIPLGIVCGYLMVTLEIKINRMVLRNKKSQHEKPVSIYKSYSGPQGRMLTLAPVWSKPKTNLKNVQELYASYENSIKQYSLLLLLLVAVLEEVIYRGLMTQFCFCLPGPYMVWSLIGVVLIFGLSHASYGWHQMIAKSLLGTLCLGVVLLCHTLLPAIIIHGYLNWRASTS